MFVIPCPHFDLVIVSHGKGESAVGKAAYQSGQDLYSERDHVTKSGERIERVVHAEIMLPDHVPRKYEDRQLLWNSVESAEKQWNAQLCRRLIVALPRELSEEENWKMLRQYCQEQFVSKGMIADAAFHYDGDGNPHAHILLTMRAMDEKGQWLSKSRKVYDLDENGERIRLKSGRWKTHKERTTDWDDPNNCEKWRHEWETIQNAYLERSGCFARVDLRSFERQGTLLIPTIHLGPEASAMERRGIRTFRGDMNREIKAQNSIIRQIMSAFDDIRFGIDSFFDRRNDDQQSLEVSLDVLLADFFESRSRERSTWVSSRGVVNAMKKDWELVSRLHSFIHENGLYSVGDLVNRLNQLEEQQKNARDEIVAATKRKEQINRIIEAGETVEELRPIKEEWLQMHFDWQKKPFEEEHADELKRYNRAYAILKNENDGKIDVDPYDFYHEQQSLDEKIVDAAGILDAIKNELTELRSIRYVVSKTKPDLLTGKPRSVIEALAAAKREIEHRDQEKQNPVATQRKAKERRGKLNER